MGVDPEKVAEAYHAFELGQTSSPLTQAAISTQTIQESMKLMLLVRSYQVGTGFSGCTVQCCGHIEIGCIDQAPPSYIGFGYFPLPRCWAISQLS